MCGIATKAMEEYFEEVLATGYIHPSKFTHHGLALIPGAYPLPLVPAALKQLRETRIFFKLYLRSAYNLVRIKEGDKWKTAFHTIKEDYEYLVMLYGLTNTPAVFQIFINEIFRDFLNKYMIVYINCILNYSPNHDDQIHHVCIVLSRLLQQRLHVKAKICKFQRYDYVPGICHYSSGSGNGLKQSMGGH